MSGIVALTSAAHCSRCGSLMACVVPDTAGREWLKKGLLCSKQRCPPDPIHSVIIQEVLGMAEQEQQQRVVIGMDPHKRSVTIEVMTSDETVPLAGGRYATDEAGFAQMRRDVSSYPASCPPFQSSGHASSTFPATGSGRPGSDTRRRVVVEALKSSGGLPMRELNSLGTRAI